MATKSDGHPKHHKKNPHHTESSPSHEPRRVHDRRASAHAADAYAGGGLQRNARIALVALVAVVVISLTLLFIGGFISW